MHAESRSVPSASVPRGIVRKFEISERLQNLDSNFYEHLKNQKMRFFQTGTVALATPPPGPLALGSEQSAVGAGNEADLASR
jgi:hypothetical protein